MQLERVYNDTPCIVEIISYTEGEPIRISGMGFGDAEPPMPEELIYEIYDMEGNELDVSLDVEEELELIETFKKH